MVCGKCQQLSKATTLATPGVKKKNEMYFGSPAGSSKGTTKTSATLGNNGIGKSKLLSKSARNPYAKYSTTCSEAGCMKKIDQGHMYCQKCAYKANNACPMCGKSSSKSTKDVPVIAGQKFTLK